MNSGFIKMLMMFREEEVT